MNFDILIFAERSQYDSIPMKRKRNDLLDGKRKHDLLDGKRMQCKHPTPFYIDLIRNSNNIVCLVGAGISVSCGIPDFRSAGGIYSLVEDLGLDVSDPQEIFDINYFKDVSPKPFYKIMYKMLVDENAKKDKLPSLTHKFLAKLDHDKKLLRCYTQNIDGLEEVAGVKSKSIKYCHGSFSAGAKCLNSKKCNFKIKTREAFIKQLILANNNNDKSINFKSNASSGSSRSLIRGDYDGVPMCLKCEEYPLKPGITFFGEKIQSNITSSLTLDQNKADLLLVLGTSLQVSPMKNIINYFSHIPHILINKQHVFVKNSIKAFDHELIGNADDIIDYIQKKLNNEYTRECPKHYSVLPPNIHCFNGSDFNDLEKALAREKNRQKEVANKDYIEGISCDICNKRIINQVDGYSCSVCFGFDICKECYEATNVKNHLEKFGKEHVFVTLKV
jgi:NAD+-dependent protein deacetylase sirtuin 1